MAPLELDEDWGACEGDWSPELWSELWLELWSELWLELWSELWLELWPAVGDFDCVCALAGAALAE